MNVTTFTVPTAAPAADSSTPAIKGIFAAIGALPPGALVTEASGSTTVNTQGDVKFSACEASLRIQIVPVSSTSQSDATAAQASFTRFVARQIARKIMADLKSSANEG